MMRNPHHANNIVITREEYHKLKRAKAMLKALEAGGVDNWDWYSEAYRDYAKSVRGKPWDNTDSEDE